MPRAWLLPLGRLHRLAGRELLATGCRSWRWCSSFPDLCYCKICTRLPKEISSSEVSCQPVKANFDHVKARRPVKSIAPLKDGSQVVDDSTFAPMHPKEISSSEISSPHDVCFVCEPVEEAIAYMKGRRQLKSIAPMKNLPFVARRSFSSGTGSVQNSSTYGSGDKDLYLENLKRASDKHKTKIDKESLKAEFRSVFRPLFVQNCLMLPCKLEDHTAAYLNGQIHGLTKEWPLYLSCLDFMLRVKSCSAEEVQHLVDYIIQRRILISEDWNNTYANIEVLKYEASSTDTSFVRGECDAAFEKLNEDCSGIAKLAILIWKENKLLYADVIEGIDCKDSIGAEIHAGLALLMKCREFGYQKLELWSDSKRVCGVISGSESIFMNDKNRSICLLLRCMKTEFVELLPVFKPRELMFLADQLLKLDGSIEYKVEKALDKWSSELKGQTVFSVIKTKWASDVIKSFAITRMKKKQEGYVYTPDKMFFLKVEKEEKFAALLKLKDVFCPDVLCLEMDRFEEKPALLCKMISKLFPGDCVKSGFVTSFTFISNGVNSVKKPLLVVWDSSLHKESYKPGYCVIVLVEDEVEVHLMEAANIKEMNITTSLYFNGVEFKEDEKGMVIKGQKMSFQGQKRSKRSKN